MIEKTINIVKVKLDGCNFLVYTPDFNIRKYVIVPVRPLFLPAIGTINIKIEIGKTIESFKKDIFELLGLNFSHYFNVKFFTTSPTLTELNSPSKTIWQYGIKESSTLVMTAEHAFCFEPVPAAFGSYFSTLNNNLSFISLPREKPKGGDKVLALPPPCELSQITVALVSEVEQKALLEASYQSPVRAEKKPKEEQPK